MGSQVADGHAARRHRRRERGHGDGHQEREDGGGAEQARHGELNALLVRWMEGRRPMQGARLVVVWESEGWGWGIISWQWRDGRQ
jgi:hypothetical protein